ETRSCVTVKLQQPKIAMNLDTGLLDDVFKYDGVIERADITESQLSNVTLDKLMIYSSVIKNCDLSHRSEEHTSELQSRFDLVCRLLLEQKNCNSQNHTP